MDQLDLELRGLKLEDLQAELDRLHREKEAAAEADYKEAQRDLRAAMVRSYRREVDPRAAIRRMHDRERQLERKARKQLAEQATARAMSYGMALLLKEGTTPND